MAHDKRRSSGTADFIGEIHRAVSLRHKLLDLEQPLTEEELQYLKKHEKLLAREEELREFDRWLEDAFGVKPAPTYDPDFPIDE